MHIYHIIHIYIIICIQNIYIIYIKIKATGDESGFCADEHTVLMKI